MEVGYTEVFPINLFYMERQLWKNLGIFLLISNTLGIFALLETIIFKFPYVTTFLVLFAILVYMNLKFFKHGGLSGKNFQ